MNNQRSVVELLRVSSVLADGGNPFKCEEKDCPNYGRSAPRHCGCYEQQKKAHKLNVKIAVAENAA